MTQSKAIYTTFGYRVDQASITAAQAAVTNMNASLAQQQLVTQANYAVQTQANQAAVAGTASVTQAQLSLNVALENTARSEALKKLAIDAQDAAMNTTELATALAALGATDAEIQQLVADMQQLQNSSSGGGIGLGGARSGLRAAGFLLGSDAGGGALRAAGQVVTLTSAFGGVGVVVGALAVGLRQLSDNTQKATDAAKAYSDALAATASSTSPEIKSQLQSQQSQLAAYRSAQTTLQGLEDQAKGFADRASKFPWEEGFLSEEAYGKAIDDLDAKTKTATGGMVTSVLGISTALENGQLVIDQTTGKIGFLTLALDSGQTAANNFAVALAEGNKRIDQSQLDLAHASADAMNMTADARRKEADSISAHITALEEAKADYYITGAAADALNAEINALENRLVAVTDTTHSWADTLADIQQRADAVNNLFDAITKLGEATQKAIEAQNNLRDATSEHNAKLAQIATDEQAKETEDRAKAAQQAEEDTRKHLDKLADIEKQYARDYGNAVANRDTLAALKAKQTRADAVDKENAGYAEQQRQLQIHLDQQLVTEREAQRKAEDAENQSWEKRRQQLVQALNDAQVEQSRANGLAAAYQRQANDAELNQRIRANTAAEQAEAVHQNTLIGIFAQGAIAIEGIALSAANFVTQIAAGLQNGNGGIGLPLGPPNVNPGGVGAGMILAPPGAPQNPQNGQTYRDPSGRLWYWDGSSWQLLPTPNNGASSSELPMPLAGARGAGDYSALQSGRSGGVNLNFAPTIHGNSADAVVKQIDERLMSYLKASGWT